MPVNKNALLRFELIDQIIRKGRYTGIEIRQKVAKILDPNSDWNKVYPKPTFYLDIATMKGENDTGKELGFMAPIETELKTHRFFYWDESFSLTKTALSGKDKTIIKNSLDLIESFEGIPFFDELKTTLQKLNSKIHSEEGEKKILKDLIQMEVRGYRGMENFTPLFLAITERRKVAFRYQNFVTGKESNLESAPLLLKEYRGRWYVLSINKKDDFVLFSLDRISNLVVLEDYFNYPKSFSVKDYFKYSFGISAPSNAKPVKIQLWFDEVQREYIKSMPLHNTQKIIKDTKKDFIIEITVFVTIELIKELRSFGNKRMKVIKPANLLEKYKDW